MTEQVPSNVDLQLLRRQYQEQATEIAELRRSKGGGSSGGLEGRISRLEGQVDKLNESVGNVRTELATLKERVAHLPSKGFIVTCSITAVTLLGGLMLLAEKLKALFGLAPT